jgi:hypothetical protein
MPSDRDWDRADRTVQQAADQISHEIDKMLRELPEFVGPQAAVELLAALLIQRQPEVMEWLGRHLPFGHLIEESQRRFHEATSRRKTPPSP